MKKNHLFNNFFLDNKWISYKNEIFPEKFRFKNIDANCRTENCEAYCNKKKENEILTKKMKKMVLSIKKKKIVKIDIWALYNGIIIRVLSHSQHFRIKNFKIKFKFQDLNSNLNNKILGFRKSCQYSKKIGSLKKIVTNVCR